MFEDPNKSETDVNNIIAQQKLENLETELAELKQELAHYVRFSYLRKQNEIVLTTLKVIFLGRIERAKKLFAFSTMALIASAAIGFPYIGQWALGILFLLLVLSVGIITYLFAMENVIDICYMISTEPSGKVAAELERKQRAELEQQGIKVISDPKFNKGRTIK